jgi:hypothetical protein
VSWLPFGVTVPKPDIVPLSDNFWRRAFDLASWEPGADNDTNPAVYNGVALR